MKKTKSKLTLRKEADKWFSIYIRLRDRGENGLVRCYTCDRETEWKKMQNGHFAPRQYLGTRYNEKNNHSQDYACNVLYNGQPSKYAQHLIKDYGAGILEEIERLRLQVIPDFPYEETIKTYKEKVHLLAPHLFKV